MKTKRPIPMMFFREDGWYIVDMPADICERDGLHKVATQNALCNPGTFEVRHALTGETLWTKTTQPTDQPQ